MINPDAVLVCIPTTEEPSVPSSRHMADCGHEVWVAMSSLPVVRNGNRVLCVDCTLTSTDFVEACEKGQVEPVAGAVHELAQERATRDILQLWMKGIQTRG
jgi:tRNA1(Val) A37 N6-methylase TrmN6